MNFFCVSEEVQNSKKLKNIIIKSTLGHTSSYEGDEINENDGWINFFFKLQKLSKCLQHFNRPIDSFINNYYSLEKINRLTI